ncbi:hypothetical protein [Gorillibacterium sp. sgz5001074]|uniref:hypothetical protein n=1 Tax=Gorillibacterium sp. sgz5001074 TaxID=3446695 RepID=UPI003F669EB7
MKRSWRGVILLSCVLFLNIVCTQLTVNNFFYERYENVLVFAAANLLLFPVAWWIYKKEAKR